MLSDPACGFQRVVVDADDHPRERVIAGKGLLLLDGLQDIKKGV